MPSRQQFAENLKSQINLSYKEKGSYALVWFYNDKAIGHSNVNKINYGNHAYMHIHIWYSEYRRKGYGTELIKQGLPLFFSNLELKELFCEPYSLNDAPNNTLEKAGFTFIDGYKTIPGSLNFEQIVHLYKITREEVLLLK